MTVIPVIESEIAAVASPTYNVPDTVIVVFPQTKFRSLASRKSLNDPIYYLLK